ncbi:MAG TPA: MgtC/SapB family protein [Aquabacterium sp.]|uniref:MgtC/SapB family protein n=1 Tax=Aquabacterium sp. TaxID=1872578 RepID=UPI002E36C249|nr:MgtC/SapB family protein [Aquabacterium sp.]HEX5371342.1 MgtC/SapB family protein [Aquabacterium sp.]
MDLLTFFLQLIASLLLGSVVGLERQWHRRLMDLKTNALVSMGACLFMAVAATPLGYVEPIRIAAQIVVGVGFIGGGLLWRQGTMPRGINTAATLWCSAAIGTLCGMGQWQHAVVATSVLVAANTVLRDVAHRFNLRMGYTDTLSEQVVFDLECDPTRVVQVREHLLRAVANADVRAITETRTDRGQALISVVALFESADIRGEIKGVLDAVPVDLIHTVSWRRA